MLLLVVSLILPKRPPHNRSKHGIKTTIETPVPVRRYEKNKIQVQLKQHPEVNFVQ